MKSKTFTGYFAISFAMLFWGCSFVWTKQLLNAGFPVFTIVCLRLLISSALFLLLFLRSGKLTKIRKGDGKKFLLLAFFEPFLYFIGEEFGLLYSSASFASVIIALIPIVVSLSMYVFEGVRLSARLLLGTLISIGGIYLLTQGAGNAQTFQWKGLCWLLLALVAAGGYSLYLARLVKTYSPVTVTCMQNILAIPFYLPFVCIFDLPQWGNMAWSAQAWTNLICLAVFCSAGAYTLYSYAAKQIAITRLSVFTNAIPIVTICVASMMGMESFTLTKFAGIFIVVCGVILSQTERETNKKGSR